MGGAGKKRRRSGEGSAMLVIRPLQETDLEDLYAMAQKAGKGLTTLPADRGLLQRKIAHAQQTFNQRCAPEAGLYLFALEDTEAGKAVGISGIQARVGDRKSTRLNSSHDRISYAVFCLKKKNIRSYSNAFIVGKYPIRYTSGFISFVRCSLC